MPCRVTYTPAWEPSPLSYWVHRQPPGQAWRGASELDPPLPRPVPGKGWARLEVEVRGFTFEFASLEEVDHCLEVLERRNLPRPARLAQGREPGWEWGRANQHWLSRLPAEARSWRFRERATLAIREGRRLLAAALGRD